MCGRYTLLAEEIEILQEFAIEGRIPSFTQSYNIAPGQNILAVIHDGQRKRAGYMRWGLVPSWSKDAKIGYKMINARSETVHEKPSFKNLLIRKRCLIIADSFYEWKQEGKHKQPKRISLKDRKLFAFAGLWDKWESDNGPLFTCTILTKDANEFMKEIHHRMPIILPKDKENDWIAPEKKHPEEIHHFLQTLTDSQFTAYDVPPYVNSAKNNDETCIMPLA